AARTLPAAKNAVEAGTYSGFPVTFAVPSGAGSVLNFSNTSANGVGVGCAGGGVYFTHPKILTIPIHQDRSFTAKTSEGAVSGGATVGQCLALLVPGTGPWKAG